MITILKYLFYKYYLLAKTVSIDKTIKYEIKASMLLSLNLMINTIVTLGVLSSLFKFSLPDLNPIVIIAYAIIQELILYYAFVSKGKYLRILERFSKETENQRVIRNWLVLFYTIATYASIAICYYLFVV